MYLLAGCCAKFSARSSLYIHSKKHLQDVDSLKTRCPVSSCNKLFTSKHSMKAHMVKQHNFSPGKVFVSGYQRVQWKNEMFCSGKCVITDVEI